MKKTNKLVGWVFRFGSQLLDSPCCAVQMCVVAVIPMLLLVQCSVRWTMIVNWQSVYCFLASCNVWRRRVGREREKEEWARAASRACCRSKLASLLARYLTWRTTCSSPDEHFGRTTKPKLPHSSLGTVLQQGERHSETLRLPKLRLSKARRWKRKKGAVMMTSGRWNEEVEVTFK